MLLPFIMYIPLQKFLNLKINIWASINAMSESILRKEPLDK